MKLLQSRVLPAWLRRPADSLRTLTADDGVDRFLIRCRSDLEEMRAKTFAIKEAGTLEWIRQSVRPGQVFCDVGANIGLYTLVAAKVVGAGGFVYAFEPHVVNCASLLENLAANRLSELVRVFSCALNDTDGCFPFHYCSLEAGAAFNQLCPDQSVAGPTGPAAVEMKHGATLDGLIGQGALRPPHHIKIDVDGNELRVLRGARQLLGGTDAPESIQVELEATFASDATRFLIEMGYAPSHRHDTHNGKRALAAGASPESVPHNMVFRKKS